MTRPIGYYVHHHGDGHRHRALAIAALDPRRIILLGTGLAGRTGEVGTINLPDDRMPQATAFDGLDGCTSRPHALHYAPLDHDGVRERMGLVARWIAAKRPALMVVDVSVEIAMLARLCATAVAFVRLSGRRDDPAHCEAYRAASLLIAPFARELDDMTMPAWVRDKTVYCPGIVGPAGNPARAAAPRSVLVVGGKGGAPQDGHRLAESAAATPDYNWRVIGPATLPQRCPDNLIFVGWTDDPLSEIAASEIIVGAAGDGLVNAVIAIGRPFICCPEPRPFDEQIHKARALQSAGAALVIEQWPSANRWPDFLRDAMRLQVSQLTALGYPHGAAKTFSVLEAYANR